jgi:histidinol dehydrogenase
MTADPESLPPLVRNAGAVFTGPFAPASVGDYVAGPSHVLPTYGAARFASALRVDDFLKEIHVVSLDRAALDRVAPHVAAIAEAEGLAAHAQSVRLRTGGQ